jgi:ankyrin repeat protein
VNPQEPSRTKLRFFQFSLWHLLVLFAALSVLLGILAPRIHRVRQERQLQRQFAREFRESQEALSNLHKAVPARDLALARRALEAGADPNRLFGGTRSLLHVAIANGDLAMMGLLLDFGADVEQTARLQGETGVLDGPPLCAAAGCNQPTEVRLEMIRLLVEHRADPCPEIGNFNAMDIAFFQCNAAVGDLLREYGLPYGPREMAAFNRLDEIKRVVSETPGVLRERYKAVYAARPGQGITLLGVALERGYREMALFLIESGAPLDTLEYYGYTPLHMAARGGDPELIRLLVARGLDVNARDDYGDTPLRDVTWRGKPEAIAALIEAGADVNTRGLNQGTPLHSAVSNHRVDIVRMVLAAGADPTIPDRFGKTALDAAREKDPEIAKLLENAVRAKQPPADN